MRGSSASNLLKYRRLARTPSAGAAARWRWRHRQGWRGSNQFDILEQLHPWSRRVRRAWGATLGVGFEYGFAPNWSIGAEYNHLWMGDANNSFTVTDPRLVGVLNNRIQQDVDMVTLRLNYRFGGWGALVTARY
jgi:outer membrane immunogenic protein